MNSKGLKKIVVIGPESTGKSTLCKMLAAYYKSTWCPEYAREYLLKNGTNYSFDNLLTIAKGQVALEDKFIQSAAPNSHLFIDTDMYVMKVWCEFVFGKCHKWILEQIVIRQYDLYLLCNNDLPWVKDELREYPDLETRETLYKIYKDLMINQPAPWVEISGSNEERLQIAVESVDQLLGK
jgi:NadR type nicotinamide-nucleotide adenylyltransferase